MATGPVTKSVFDVSKNYKVPFGRHKGRTLNDVAIDDDGLLYLDWMRSLPDLREETARSLNDFLDYDPVARDLDVAIAAKKGQRR